MSRVAFKDKSLSGLYSRLLSLLKTDKEIVVSIVIALLLTSVTIFIYVRDPSRVEQASGQNSIEVESEVEISNGASSTTALKQSEIDWQKKLKPDDPSQPVTGSIIERVDATRQVYVAGSMQLPEGWTAEWSLSPSNTPEDEIVWTSTEPADGAAVTFIRINTGNRDTLRPSVQSSIPKPPSGVKIDRSGYKPSGPVIYDKKIYQVMMAVKVTTDTSKYTLDCYDLATYSRCSDYPKYISSESGSALTSNSLADTGPEKDISTAMNLQIVQGSGDQEGKIYIPAQKTNQYGVACVDLAQQLNCGFTVMGSTATAPPGVQNPSILAGFIEKDGKLYGHANDPDQPNQTVVCYDLDQDAVCSGYSDTTLSAAQTMVVSQHSNSYQTPGSHVLSGNRLMWVVQYRHGSTNLNATQSLRGSVHSCFDISTRLPCTGPGGGLGWSHGYGGEPQFTNATSPLGFERGYASFIWKKPGGSGGYTDYAVCTIFGLGNGFDPARRCFLIDTGTFLTGADGFPPFMFPTQWMITPWQSASNIVTLTHEDGHLRSYFPMYNTNSGDAGTDNLPYAAKRKGAVLCYDWETQRPCDKFGNKLRYWHEINDGNSGDVGYVFDGECMWATGDYGDIWTFNPKTGEQPCRTSKVDLTVSAQGQQFHCDGNERVFEWDRVRLAKSSMYDFDEFEVIVRDPENSETVLEQGNIRESGYLDIADINYAEHDELAIEVRPTVLNDSPWANNKTPYVAAIMEADNVQYCFKTRVRDKCNIKNVSTTSNATILTETDTLTPGGTQTVPVNQPQNEQCFQDLRVTPTVSKNQVANNEAFTYTAQIRNKANNDPNNLGSIPSSERSDLARVEVTLPSSVEFISSTPAGGVKTGNKVVWNNISIGAQATRNYQVTVRTPSGSTANLPAPLANTVYAATVQETLTFQSQAIFSGDNDPSDNTSSTNVTFVNTVPDPEDPGDNEEPATETPTNPDQPVDQDQTTEPERVIIDPPPFQAPTQPNNQSGPLTPRFISNVIPPALRNQTESLFKFVNSAVTPIPNPVAVALPYGTIAFLMAFASIYVYQAVQEGKNRKTLLNSFKRFKRTEELRRNYVDLTSHYLNTPIATMQSSIELMESTGNAPSSITEAAKLRLSRVVQHVQLLLSKADELTSSAQTTAGVMEPIAKKRSLLSAGVVIPVVVVLLITAIINAIFVWADKYSASLVTVAIQSLYFGLSFIAMLLAFNSYRNQKYATAVAEHELGLEKKLAASQTAFIANTSKTIEGDIVELEQMSPTIATSPKGSTFVNGLQSLKKATSKLDYLNRLTNHSVVPTLPNQTIKTLTDDVLASLEDFASQKRVTLETNIESGLTALVDEDGLRQMLYSTIHNAIKFNRPGGQVVLSISRQGNSNIKILVRDNGQGIAKDKLDQLFTPFGRGTDSKEYNFEGFGLDLYMNKLIAEQCGGSISLDSTKDVGTTLSILLPA